MSLDKALKLFDTNATLHQIETYLWLLNNRLYVLAELSYQKWVPCQKPTKS
jgi:hypothetical protein